MSEPVEPTVRQATCADMMGVADVYLAAFPESLEDLGIPGVRPLAVADIMTICQRAEPAAFTVAEGGGSIIGYAICPARSDRIWRTAIIRGHVSCMFWHWLTGRYGVGLRAAVRLSHEKLLFWRHGALPEADCAARILSLAVHPDAQGMGLGKLLTNAGLDYLREQGASRIRLEVRPDNAPAHHIYEKLGFRVVGTVSDTRGPWDVMVLDMPRTPPPPGGETGPA